jgi:hypothetical protein
MACIGTVEIIAGRREIGIAIHNLVEVIHDMTA